MWFTSQHAECDVSEELAEHQQQEQEQDHRHDDDVMTDAHTDVKPAAVVTYQEEEVLKHHTFGKCCTVIQAQTSEMYDTQ